MSITSTGGTVTLTTAQAAVARVFINGSLASNLIVQTASTFGGRIYFYNNCTLNGYTVTVKNGASDPRGYVVIPNFLFCPVVFDGNAAYYDNYQSVPPGTIHCYAGLTAPPGFLLCTGASLLVANYSDLFNSIQYTYGGTGANFNIPDTRGRLLAGADNMGGSAAGRLTGYGVATTGGEQTHVLTTAELAAHNHAVTDPGHNHAITDPGHTHVATNVIIGSGGGYSFAASGTGSATNLTTTSSTTGISINTNTTGITTQNNGSGTGHNNVQPTIAINHIIRY